MARAEVVGEIVASIPFSDGSGKKRYVKVGALLKHANNDPSKGPGFSIMLDRYFNPAGVPVEGDQASVPLSVYHPANHPSRADQPSPRSVRRSSNTPFDDFDDDDIPF